jgi:hypothetical protein
MAPKPSVAGKDGAGPSKQPTTSKPTKKSSPKPAAAKVVSPKPKPPAKDGDAPVVKRKKVEPKSLAEIEAQYESGSIKRIMVEVLKAQKGCAGLTGEEIATKAKEMKLKTCTEEEVKKIKVALTKDPNFCRLEKGIYSLHTFHPKMEVYVRAVVSKKTKADGEAGPSSAKNNAAGGGAQTAGRLQASLVLAQRKAKEAAATVSRHKTSLKRALNALHAAKEAAGIVASSEKAEDQEGVEAATAASPAAGGAAKESKKERDAGVPPLKPKDLAKFELKESEKEYKGDPEDRKAMLAHRQKMQAKARDLEKAKEAFIKAHNDKYEKEKNSKRDKLAALRRAERAVATARNAVAAAEKEAGKVGLKLHAQVTLVRQSGGKVDEKQQRQLQPVLRAFKPMDDNELDVFLAAQAAEKAKGAGSSSQQQQLRPDVFSPDWLNGDDAARLATTLYVSDILNQFGRNLGLSKPLQFADFEKALTAASEAVPEEKRLKKKKLENDDNNNTLTENDDLNDVDGIVQSRTSQFYKGPASPLHDVYYTAMRILVEDMRGKLGTNASITRRLALITPGSWPEALRRDILASRTSEQVAEYDRPDDQVVDAASSLVYDGADGLTADQHLALLQYLVDEVLQTEHLRKILQKREEEAIDVKRDVREEMAQKRSSLKELSEAEKEVLNNTKRRKLEILGQLQASKEGDATTGGAGGATGGGKANGGGAVGGPSRQLSLDTPELPDEDASDANDSEEEEEEQQPSFELPEELQTFKGNPKNKKALEEFEKKQAAAQKKLDAQRVKYLAERIRIQREKAEKAMEKLAIKKEATAEGLAKAQEALEEKMEKLAIRRAPLGSDRHHNRYWILPKSAILYVEDEESGRWGCISTVGQLDALMKSLDKRGLRELALLKALEKRYDTLSAAMRRAGNVNGDSKDHDGKDASGSAKEEEEAKKKKKERVAVEPVRQSSRERKQAEFFDPITGKTITRAQQQPQPNAGGSSEKDAQIAALYAANHAKHKALAPYFGPCERVAFFEAVEMLLALHKDALELDIEGTDGSWEEWLSEVSAAAAGKMAVIGRNTEAAPNAAFLIGLLQGKALEMENAIYNAGDNPETSEDVGEEEEEEEEEEQGAPRRSGRNTQANDSENEDGSAKDGEEEGKLVDLVMFSPVKGGNKSVTTKLWKNGEWRQRWLLDLRQGSSNARLVYCLGVLQQHSAALFRFLKGDTEEEPAAAAPAAGPLGKPPLPPEAAQEISRKKRMAEREEALENKRAKA